MHRPVRLLERDPASQVTREVIIGQEEFLIGRGGDCDLRLNEEAVSRHHCLLRVTPQGVDVSDLGSSNGTFVNGQRVISQEPIHTGDALRIGGVTFIVDLQDGAGIDPRAPRPDLAATTWRMKNQDS